MPRLAWHFCVAFGLAACLAHAAVADTLSEFKKAKNGLQQQLRSRQPADRMAALAKLETFPVADSVRLIERSLEDDDDEVRQAAYQSLLNLSGNHEVCETLLQTVRRGFQQRGAPADVAAVLGVLLTSKIPSVQRDTNKLLEKVGGGRKGTEVILGLADELGSRQDPLNALPLAALAKTDAFANSTGVKRAVVDALVQTPSAAAVRALIEILDKVGGEAQADGVEYLTRLTEQPFGMEVGAWQRWFENEGEKFEYPEELPRGGYRDGSLSPAGQYYGLPLFAKRVVFIIDTSDSMKGPRIFMAKRELARAVSTLPPDVYFNMISFNTGVAPWKNELVKATERFRDDAVLWINNLPAHRTTASYDALEAGFRFDTEAIYFVSDGEPTTGKIVAPADIITAITQMNHPRRVSVYTVGIAAGFPGSMLDQFLSTLAKQNLGLYRRVDE